MRRGRGGNEDATRKGCEDKKRNEERTRRGWRGGEKWTRTVQEGSEDKVKNGEERSWRGDRIEFTLYFTLFRFW